MRLSYLKNWGIEVKYYWNYVPSKLLLHFIKARLDQLNNKHTKITVNSTKQFFESRYQKKGLVKVWSFLTHQPQNDGPVKFLQNWMETIFQWPIISNFTNIRDLAQWKCIVWKKYDLPIINSVCAKVWFTKKGPPKMLFFNFYLFDFSKFQMRLVKNRMKKPFFFIMDFKGSYEVLLRHTYFWSTHFWQWNDGFFKIFEICMELHFVS